MLIKKIYSSPTNRLTLCDASLTNTVTHSNEELLKYAVGFAEYLRINGVSAGGRVCVVCPTSVELVVTVLAAWIARAAICVLPFESAIHHQSVDKFINLITHVKPSVIVASNSFGVQLRAKVNCPLIEAQEAVLRRSDKLLHPLDPVNGEDTAILQFTSGSTGAPKAVVITHQMLATNCEAIRQRVRLNQHDVALSWLPLHHDMGMSVLTGFFWSQVGQLILMPPSAFARRPISWLTMMSEHNVTLSAAPSFAYALLGRLEKHFTDLRLDLSALRYCWVGAEPVFEQQLTHFFRATAKFGLCEHAVQPAYGMAESVVAVSLGEPGTRFRTLSVAAKDLFENNLVTVLPEKYAGALTFVSNGRPLTGIRVAIRSEAGEVLEERQVGCIWLSGDSIIRHYFEQPGERDTSGWFDTGDLGFILDGEIYITGRRKDLIVRGGVNVSAHLIEAVTESCLNLKSGSVAAFSHLDAAAGKEVIVVAVGLQPEADSAQKLTIDITTTVAQKVGVQIDQILFLNKSVIPKTTSGKIKRSQLKADYARGEFLKLHADRDVKVENYT